MESILADVCVSMSDFKRNPAAVLRDANRRPVAVLNHNRPAFYMVDPEFFKALLDEVADRDLQRTAIARLADLPRAVEVDIATL